MQSQFRRYLIIGGMVGALVLIVVSFTLISRHDSYESTCTKFMAYIKKSDSKSTYAMFSANAQQTGNQAAWSNLMKGWYNYFFKANATLTSTNDLTPAASDTNKHPTPRKELNYTVDGPASSIRVNCYVIKGDKGFQIDAFNIGPNTAATPVTPTSTGTSTQAPASNTSGETSE
ncbi:MAG TPA: hypothetical protein VLI54_02680 [Bacillota bacterium]|nr:hypothetical protein [Bacillota bacterium]